MADSATNTNYTGLGYYLREILFKEFAENRLPIEEKWERNLNAFKAISDVTWKKGEGEDWRSKTYIQLPKQKIMAGYAMVMDMLLQGGKIPFALIPSPLDNIVLEDLPEQERENAEDTIDDATAIINQQLQDCHADRQLMRNVMCAAIYGETYGTKLIHSVTRKGYKMINMNPNGQPAPGGTPDPRFTRFEKYQVTKNQPAYKYLSNWNCFRDIESEDLQEGQGFIYRDLVCPYDLQKMKGKPFYIDKAIDRAIESCKDATYEKYLGDKSLPPVLRDIKNRKKNIEHTVYWCRVPVKIVKQFEQELSDKYEQVNFDILSDFENDGIEVEIMAEMADKEVIRYAINETGERPQYRIVWEDKIDHAEATGIADNVQDVAQVVNGMVRAFEDNLKLVANIILAIKKRYLAPGALKKGITPGMELEIAEECDDARKALQQVTITDITPSILNGIPLFERYADENSQMPKILQGVVADKHRPDTLGEMNILQQNSGKYLGSVIKNFDEQLIEPMTQAFYEYNMEDPDLQKGKGNFITQGLGFTSFQDRVMKMQKLMQGLNLVMGNEVLLGEVKPRAVLFDFGNRLTLSLKPR